MLELGSLAFATPWLLVTLTALPALYWLLRVTPPSPRRLLFPAIRILDGLPQNEEMPARTPWWLLLLRILAAALIILALSRPILNPDAALHGSGPVLIVVDNSWAAAKNWPARQDTLKRLIDRTDRQGRGIALLATAPDRAVADTSGAAIAVTPVLPAGQAYRRAQAIQPQPWPADRPAALQALETLELSGSVSVFWLADGLRDPLTQAFAEILQAMGSLTVLLEVPDRLAKLLSIGRSEGRELSATLTRPAATGVETVTVRVIADDGRLLARELVDFEAGAVETTLALTLPLELRNQVARLEIEAEQTAGAVLLADERWRRRPVGIVTTAALDNTQPLLNEVYYLEQALAPFAEIQRGEFSDLAAAKLAVVLLPDSAGLTAEAFETLTAWVEAGGTLLRFGGPRLAQEPDALLPVRLRVGTRQLGGALSWAKPAQLAPFDADSPFDGLVVPTDVAVRRQVLAEPELDLAAKTWARLSDGTPLVTADARGDGWVVLIHTTADTSWSDLALSGLFVEMLQRIVQQSRGISGEEVAVALPPFRTLRADGRLRDPAPDAVAIEPGALPTTVVSPRHPPGLYGSLEARTAVNLADHLGETYGPLPAGSRAPTPRPIATLPDGVDRIAYGGTGGAELKHWLLLAAVLLVMIDMLASLALRGLLPFGQGGFPSIGKSSARLGGRPGGASAGVVGTTAALLLLTGALAVSDPAVAQIRERTDGNDSRTIDATTQTRLAYVITGNDRVDATSRAGLLGLTEVLRRRTAVETASPLGVDPEVDELIFFPLLYWPVTETQPPLSRSATDRINAYLRTGGTILFDTRDAGNAAPGFITGSGLASGPGGQMLRHMARSIDIPALQTVPPAHVLTKAFYLLQDFPGRYAGSGLWVELPDGRVNDGVASVIVGGNDWAAAWAIDENGRPMFPVDPGGERQREMAYRFGVNLAMYALTGNYKADQVHVPAILERLGQ